MYWLKQLQDIENIATAGGLQPQYISMPNEK